MISQLLSKMISYGKEQGGASAMVASQLSIPKLIDSWDSLRPITFGDGFGGISDITMGPDGYLYVVSINTGIIYRIIPANHVTPEPTTNRTLFK